MFGGDCLRVGAGAVKWNREIHLSITLNQYLLATNVGIINNDYLKSLILQREILLIQYKCYREWVLELFLIIMKFKFKLSLLEIWIPLIFGVTLLLFCIILHKRIELLFGHVSENRLKIQPSVGVSLGRERMTCPVINFQWEVSEQVGKALAIWQAERQAGAIPSSCRRRARLTKHAPSWIVLNFFLLDSQSKSMEVTWNVTGT